MAEETIKSSCIIIIIYLLLAYSPVNRSGSPQGFPQDKFRTQVENMYTK